MLSHILISDLALIRSLSLPLEKGFTVITGETGAGKSLLLDSFGLFLSPKGAKDLVRRGAPSLTVSLTAQDLTSSQKEMISDLVTAEEAEEGITLSRTVTAEGKSTAKLCGRPVPAARLSALAASLVTLHGQNAAVGLLEEKNHLSYLDLALDAKGKEALADYREAFADYREAKTAQDALEKAVSEGKEKLALYEYQLSLIEKVRPKKGEEEALEAKLVSLQKYEKEYEALTVAHRALSGGEKGKGAVFLLQAAAQRLSRLEEEKEGAERLFALAEEAREMQEEIVSKMEELGEDDPGQVMDRIRSRMDALYRLKMQLGMTLDEILSYTEEIKEKKDLTLRGKDDIKKGCAALKEKEKRLLACAKILSDCRRVAAEVLTEEIHETLAFLDMPSVLFETVFSPLPSPVEYGTEKIAFFLSANAGEEKRPLAKVASGGESSRIMLALCLTLLKEEGAMLIFDEIDTGISGSTAQKIGLSLKKLGLDRQVLCVTHSAQVATLADRHLLISKKEENGRTETSLALLDEQGAKKENARLLGGKDLSAEALSAAQELRREGLNEWKKLQSK